MSGEARRILLVDDDADFSESVATYLGAHGYEVVRASDGTEGLERARRDRPDLILMDVVMRERTEGFFTVQELRHDPVLREVPVFVVSSIYGQEPEFRVPPEHDWLGQDEFFAKPVEMERLLEAIRRYLGEPAEPVPPTLGVDP